MQKVIIEVGGVLSYAAENPIGYYVLLPCASCQYEKEESSGEHCNNCCNGTENNFINKGYTHSTQEDL